MKNMLENKFWCAAKSFVAVAVLGVSAASLSADTLTITWTGTIGELETTIMNDNYAHDVYLLEANRVYLQQQTIELESGCHIVGAPYADGEHPATIQPIPGDDGTSQFSGWPATNIRTYGEDQSYEFKNLLFNGAFADGSTTLFGVLATYGERNSILVDHVTSVHNQVITYFCFGQEEHWTLTNNTAVQYSSYPAGMWFGGFWWGGGGGWTGTVESLLIQNNTIEGAHGQTMVIYDNGLVNRDGNEMIHIDHNTFVNSILETKYYRHGNNTHFTNNLFINQMSGGQTRNAHASNIALGYDLENGHGKTVTLYQGACSDSTLLADGNCWDNTNRNIHYNNNAWFDTPELLDMFAMDPWCFERTEIIYDEYGYEIDQITVTICDTMIAGQSKWLGDSTIAQFVNNVSETNNIHAADLGWNLDPAYINAQIGRTEDWLDNGVHDTHTDHFWMHQADGDNISVQWPLPMDFSYGETSAAATHCTHGGPLGSTHHMDHDGALFNPNLDDRVFISEVAEGTSNNKYIEIYNGTGEDVDLSAYSISTCNNGCDNEGEFDYPNNVTFESGTIVANGDVYVVCHGSASDGIQAECDQTFTYLSNGDDLYALTGAGATADSYVVVDNVGDFGDDPGAGWDVAGIGSATKDHTLIRKGTVTNGNTDWAASAGTDAQSSEWIVSDKPTADYTSATLGSHTMTGPIVTVHFNVYAPDGPDTVWATGSFEDWSGYGVAMTDPDGNGIYNGTIELSENFGDVEYKYTHGGWDVETGANTGDWCDWIPDDFYNNFGFSVEEHDVYLPIFVWGQGCGQWYSDMAGRPWMIANEPGAIRVGPWMGSGEWWSNSQADLETRACYFDDRYYFSWNGEFHNDFGGDTWIESWQDGVGYDSCRAPVAPHDNSNPASYSFDAEAGTVTLHGAGAFLGVPKAFNGGELTSPAGAPESVTYMVDQFDEDSAMVYIDVSENETGSAWWTYTMVRESEPTMVTFWLDAYDVPCDGSPYLAGSFNGWNATDIEMTYDEEWDEYYADVWLMPGYYEYKFACFNWSNSENIPVECSDPNDDGYNNRYVEVPELDGEDWYEVDVVGWGECPEPDPCDLLDCSNLHFAGVMESGLINHIADTLGFTEDSVASMIYLGAVTMGVYSTWGIDTATFMPEFSDPEYSNFLYLVEYPYGIPDTSVYYYWWWAVDAYDLSGDEFGDLQEYGLGEECTFAYENYDEYNDTTYAINVRYWDPSLWEEELYMLAMGDDDVDPYDVWNVDLYGSCEFWFDGSGDDMTYIGNFQGHEYYAVDNFLTWYEANLEAQNAGGYLATITSPEENDFVRSSIESQDLYDAHWFGLIDIMSDGTGWGWENGEPLSYTNWAAGEPNGPGQENCGEFYSSGEWNDTHCDGVLPFVVEFGDVEEPEEPTITSYTYSVQTLDSYNNGDYATTVLPNVDVNDGLHTIAYFDTVGTEGPYAGLYTLFFDSNFNGQLDSTDFNMLSWSDFGNDENVLLLVDNGPNDMNPDVGVYETITHHDSDEGGFIRVQGANYFMIALSPDYTISGYTTVTPVSGSTNRVTGTGTMPDPDTGELVGVPNMWVSMWDWYDGNLVGMGITGPDGSYDIGVDINDSTEVWISVDENYNITNRYVGVFENGGWGGYGGTWIQATLGPDGTVQDFDVIKMNTLVHGQVTAPDGSPVAGADIDIAWTYGGDYYGYYNSTLWNYTETDDYGYYSFWAINGESVNISIWSQYEDYYEEVNIFSETYDEYLGGFYFNHDIMLMDPPDLPQTELLDNNSFEDYYYDYYTGNNHAEQWWNFPWDDNFHVAQTGEGIYGSEETFTAYDGEASLKMWGQYNGDGVDNTTDYYQSFGQQIDPGAVINAGAMMMSHPGDWIGGGSGLNNGQVFVSYFDEYWNFLGMDVSESMDTSYAAGEWHYMNVIGEVPDGATNVNIGVRYNQVYGSDGSEGHGSIYYDNVQAYTSASDVHTVQIYGMTEQDEFDEYGEHIGSAPLPNAPVYVWNENYFIEVMSDDYGWWFAEVPVNQLYYVVGGYVDGFYESSFEEVFACDGYYYYDYDEYCYYDDYYGYEYCYDDYYDYCDNQANIHFTQNDAMWFEVQGQVTDASGNAVYDAQVRLENHDTGQNYWTGTDYMGYFSVDVPYGIYDAHAGGLNGYMLTHEYGVEVMSQGIFLSLTLEAAEFTGALEGLVIFHGNPPENPAGLWMWSDDYAGGGVANEDGFYSIPLPDGIYNIWVSAPNFEGFYQENAFEIAGNTVMFNVELYEHGFAGAPQIVDLHDIPNDQGRQMRSVWSPGIPGNWEYFTQYSIWRKVNGAPVELWDYVETVPWHGMDEPYAAVVATLGDSSMHGIYESTFMVTAHTEDINIWFDSQPVSGYSIDNLHPGTPMSLVYSHDPGAVSLSWSGSEDEDFSHHNIYRQDIASSDPAIVFTTVDSFYVDQEVTDVGAYQYWVTAVDLSGLESEASNSVSAVLSADENLGLPTEFALKQNYPNPFNPSTQIQYALPEETRVVISIYDLIGRKVRTLVNDVQDAGYRTVIWNSTNDMGRLVSAGVYIYSIQAGDFVQNRKMVLMK